MSPSLHEKVEALLVERQELHDSNTRLRRVHAALISALERVVDYHVPKINPLSDAAILSARGAIAKYKESP